MRCRQWRTKGIERIARSAQTHEKSVTTKDDAVKETTTERSALLDARAGKGAFWRVAAAISSIVLGANTPLPLLTVYQSQWGFSTALLSIVYGLYTVGVVITVFLVGPLSDTVGRKRILVPALGLMGVGLLTCLFAPNVWVLMVGRILQGFAVGAGVTTAVAMLGDLNPDPRDHGRVALTATVATVVGLAGGPLVAGSLAEFGPAPTVLPYAAALALIIVSLAGVARAPETVPRPGAFKLKPARIHIPPAIAASFYLATFVELVAYAVAGTFAGLGSSFARDLLGIQGHFAAGLVVALLFVASAVGQLSVRGWPLHQAMQAGLLVLLVGLICFAISLTESLGALFFLSAIVLGVGHGLSYLGSQELIDRIAPKESRAEVFSGFQLGLYIGATVPAVAVGLAAKVVSFEIASLAFVAVIAALAVMALAWIWLKPSGE
jgi:MFS family permease